MSAGLPVLPYPETGGGRTSGWSGSDTSRARANRDDSSGVTSQRQRQTLWLLYGRGQQGATWGEVAAALGLHHGQASGTLSNLHKAARIDRLAEVRDGCHIYVLPEFTQGRDTQPPRRNRGPDDD